MSLGRAVKRPLRAPWCAAGELRLYFLALPPARAKLCLTVQAGKPMTVQGDGAGGFRNYPLALSDSGAADFSKALYVDHFFMLA